MIRESLRRKIQASFKINQWHWKVTTNEAFHNKDTNSMIWQHGLGWKLETGNGFDVGQENNETSSRKNDA